MTAEPRLLRQKANRFSACSFACLVSTFGVTSGCRERNDSTAHTTPGSSTENIAMDSPFAPEREDSPRASGAEFVDPDFRLSVRAATVCQQTAPFIPPAGHRRVSVPLTLQATGRRVIPISALAFRLVDAEGDFHGATLAGCGEALETKALAPGDQVSGSVAFDVPEQGGELELQFDPFLIGRPQVLARVKIPGDPGQREGAK